MAYTRSVSVSLTNNPVPVPELVGSDASLTVISSGTEPVAVASAAAGTINFTPPFPAFGAGTRIITATQDVQWDDGLGIEIVVGNPHPITTEEVQQIETSRLAVEEFHKDDTAKAKAISDLKTQSDNNKSAIGDANSGLTKAVADNTTDIGNIDLSVKVDKVSGRGLSEENFSTTQKTKLENIESDAEVNVQADWSEASSASDAFIKNKPTLNFAPSKVAAENTAGGYAVLDAQGKLPTTSLPAEQDLSVYLKTTKADQDYANKVDYESTKQVVEELHLTYTDQQIDNKFAEKDDFVPNTRWDSLAALDKLPIEKILGLKEKLNALTTGDSSTSIDDLVEKALKDQNVITSVEREKLKEKKVTLYVNENDSWYDIDDNLSLRMTKNKEFLSAKYHTTNNYPSNLDGDLSYKVRHDGNNYNGKDSDSNFTNGDVIQDWWGGWFLNHHEFNGNEEINGKVTLRLDNVADQDGDNFKEGPDYFDKVYTIRGKRRKSKSDMKKYNKGKRWHFEVTVSGYNLSSNPDYVENK